LSVPVFVDVEPETLCINVELARKAITVKTKAIILVSANGRSPKSGLDSFKALAEEFGLVLIEDAAQSLGSRYTEDLHVGRFGKIGSFSFSAPKIISTGQGGALITDDDEINFKLRRLKDFGRSGGGSDVHDSIGYNFKFTELQASIGIEQMKKLDYRVSRKKEIFKLYQDNLIDIDGIKLFNHDLEKVSPWFVDSLVDHRDELQTYLKHSGIGSRVMYPPIHRQKAYNLVGEYPVSEMVGNRGLWLPSATQLCDQQIVKICSAIRSFYKG
jgi:perosamine synthetase